MLTKIVVPPPSDHAVERPALYERLDRGVNHALTCLVSPPGYGKTTLLSTWIRARGLKVAWLSLDEFDDTPPRFINSVTEALRAADPSLDPVSPQNTTLPCDPEPNLVNALWLPLINEIAASDRDYTLVLDDFQAIQTPVVQRAIQFLIDHLPPNLHLMVASRETLPLSLSKLRMREDLEILDADALRFTPSESAEFLNNVSGLCLDAEEAATIQDRVDGWPAGIRLAALSLENAQNRSAVLARFGGDDRHVLNYLREEVFGQLPEKTRSFLVKTSILTRLSADLCAAVAGQDEAQHILDDLERRNLFIIQLDQSGGWYRYHTLMSEFLAHILQREFADLVPDLNRRAAIWHEQNDFVDEAVRYALEAEDDGFLAAILERHCDDFLGRGHAIVVRQWLDKLPEPFLLRRPWLAARLSWSYASMGRQHEVTARIDLIDRAINCAGRERSDAQRDTETRRVLAGLRARAACMRGDLASTIKACEEFRQGGHTESTRMHASILWSQGEALTTAGNPSAALPLLAKGREMARQVGYPPLSHACCMWSVKAMLLQGRLAAALELCEEEIAWSEQRKADRIPSMGLVLAEQATILVEIDRTSTCVEPITRAIELSLSGGARPGALAGHLAFARLEYKRRRVDRALNHLAKADELGRVTNSVSLVAQTAAQTALIKLHLGFLDEAAAWARTFTAVHGDQGAAVQLFEFENLVLARVRVAEGRHQEAIEILERLQPGMLAAGRRSRVIALLICRAIAYDQMAERAKSIEALGQALDIAEAEGFCRIFIDESSALTDLLAAATRIPADQIGIAARDYANQLLRIITQEATEVVSRAATGSSTLFSDQDDAELYQAYLSDPLTPRETELLQLISDGLSNQQIADVLNITINTVKGHIKHIFSKIDVRSRTQAVARARRWQLISNT